jgi:hypothetical protein
VNKLSDKKHKKAKKIKCAKCEFYDTPFDYCTQKGIEDCTKQVDINFSQCDSFLTREDLMFF